VNSELTTVVGQWRLTLDPSRGVLINKVSQNGLTTDRSLRYVI